MWADIEVGSKASWNKNIDSLAAAIDWNTLDKIQNTPEWIEKKLELLNTDPFADLIKQEVFKWKISRVKALLESYKRASTDTSKKSVLSKVGKAMSEIDNMVDRYIQSLTMIDNSAENTNIPVQKEVRRNTTPESESRNESSNWVGNSIANALWVKLTTETVESSEAERVPVDLPIVQEPVVENTTIEKISPDKLQNKLEAYVAYLEYKKTPWREQLITEIKDLISDFKTDWYLPDSSAIQDELQYIDKAIINVVNGTPIDVDYNKLNAYSIKRDKIIEDTKDNLWKTGPAIRKIWQEDWDTTGFKAFNNVQEQMFKLDSINNERDIASLKSKVEWVELNNIDQVTIQAISDILNTELNGEVLVKIKKEFDLPSSTLKSDVIKKIITHYGIENKINAGKKVYEKIQEQFINLESQLAYSNEDQNRYTKNSWGITHYSYTVGGETYWVDNAIERQKRILANMLMLKGLALSTKSENSYSNLADTWREDIKSLARWVISFWSIPIAEGLMWVAWWAEEGDAWNRVIIWLLAAQAVNGVWLLRRTWGARSVSEQAYDLHKRLEAESDEIKKAAILSAEDESIQKDYKKKKSKYRKISKREALLDKLKKAAGWDIEKQERYEEFKDKHLHLNDERLYNHLFGVFERNQQSKTEWGRKLKVVWKIIKNLFPVTWVENTASMLTWYGVKPGNNKSYILQREKEVDKQLKETEPKRVFGKISIADPDGGQSVDWTRLIDSATESYSSSPDSETKKAENETHNKKLTEVAKSVKTIQDHFNDPKLGLTNDWRAANQKALQKKLHTILWEDGQSFDIMSEHIAELQKDMDDMIKDDWLSSRVRAIWNEKLSRAYDTMGENALLNSWESQLDNLDKTLPEISKSISEISRLWINETQKELLQDDLNKLLWNSADDINAYRTDVLEKVKSVSADLDGDIRLLFDKAFEWTDLNLAIISRIAKYQKEIKPEPGKKSLPKSEDELIKMKNSLTDDVNWFATWTTPEIIIPEEVTGWTPEVESTTTVNDWDTPENPAENIQDVDWETATTERILDDWRLLRVWDILNDDMTITRPDWKILYPNGNLFNPISWETKKPNTRKWITSYPDGRKKLVDWTMVFEDGSKKLANWTMVDIAWVETATDGTMTYPDGRIKTVYWDVMHPSWAIDYADGRKKLANWTIIDLNWNKTAIDWTITFEDGRVKALDWTITHLNGDVESPDGSKKLADGTIVYSDRTVYADRTEFHATGKIVFEDGRVEYKNGDIEIDWVRTTPTILNPESLSPFQKNTHYIDRLIDELELKWSFAEANTLWDLRADNILDTMNLDNLKTYVNEIYWIDLTPRARGQIDLDINSAKEIIKEIKSSTIKRVAYNTWRYNKNETFTKFKAYIQRALKKW